jgi:DNA-binding response OmpR family regulator
VTDSHAFFSLSFAAAVSDKPTILVVDDDLPILTLMRSLLREFGFEPVTAATGQEALEYARKLSPALVLLDRHMPGMKGDEVIRTLRAEFESLPILIVSGDPVSRDELDALGADDAVQKPFDVAALIARIRQHVMDGDRTSK